MPKFVAFLRGINIGGHKKVPMSELKNLLGQKSYKNVKTVLASGNVVFEASIKEANELQNILENSFGFSIPTIIIPFEDLLEITKNNPFDGVDNDSNVKYYVTFTDNTQNMSFTPPISKGGNAFRIVKQAKYTVYSVLDSDKLKTTDAMKILETKWGKKITTRNYNTILKVAKL